MFRLSQDEIGAHLDIVLSKHLCSKTDELILWLLLAESSARS
jgi:hypothetical protein